MAHTASQCHGDVLTRAAAGGHVSVHGSTEAKFCVDVHDPVAIECHADCWGLGCHLGQCWSLKVELLLRSCQDPAIAKDHVWVCDPTTARLCVEVVTTRAHAEARILHPNLWPCWESGDNAAARAIQICVTCDSMLSGSGLLSRIMSGSVAQ